MIKKLAALFLVFLASASAFGAGGDDIVGVWLNQEKDARIEIYKCGEKYCGKVVWLKEPDYPEGSKDGAPGTPKLDHNNPDAALRKSPIIGLQIVRDFRYAGGDKWAGGKL